MIYLITLIDNNRKMAIYIEGNIHGIYRYLAMTGYPTTFIPSVQQYNHFGDLYSINKYTSTPNPVI